VHDKQRQLIVAKRRATALLAGVTVAFIVVTVWGGRSSLAGYLQATAEASMVGGLADWFAVTALFRRPLGLPIPHTAIVVERKDQFGETLGDFIQESFLTPDTIVERIRLAAFAPRLAVWLATPANAAKVAGQLADGAVALADLVNDDDVNGALVGVLRKRAEAVALAPLAGRTLRRVTESGRYLEVLEVAAQGLDRYLDEHRDDLHRLLAEEAPWWLPDSVEHRIFDRGVDRARAVLREAASNPDSRLRRLLEDQLAQLSVELETSPSLLARGEHLKHEVLSQAQLPELVASLWRDLKGQLSDEAADPDSAFRLRLAAAVLSTGERLQIDPVLAARVQEAMEAGGRYVAEHFHGEIAALVSGTIARWDADETSGRLELLLGPDLQYIRINGTVVGAAAGLALHAIARALG